jgi:hypothetical protein
VLAIYAKSGGKAAKHSWVSDSSNIAAVSNIPVQLVDLSHTYSWGAIPCNCWWANLACQEILLVAFLCTLEVAPSQTESGLKISPQDGVLFRNLRDNSAHMIFKAVTSLAGRAKKSQGPDD